MPNDVTNPTMQQTKFPHGARVYLRSRKHDNPGEVTGGPTDDGLYIVHWGDDPHPTCVHEYDLISEEQAMATNVEELRAGS
jgi:hypothetical protein